MNTCYVLPAISNPQCCKKSSCNRGLEVRAGWKYVLDGSTCWLEVRAGWKYVLDGSTNTITQL
jgi:hypothetical protein